MSAALRKRLSGDLDGLGRPGSPRGRWIPPFGGRVLHVRTLELYYISRRGKPPAGGLDLRWQSVWWYPTRGSNPGRKIDLLVEEDPVALAANALSSGPPRSRGMYFEM